MHICPRCETTLSNNEVTDGYQDIKDLTLTAKFELEEERDTFVLA
jgi:isoleucyl-tRNA synthetase